MSASDTIPTIRFWRFQDRQAVDLLLLHQMRRLADILVFEAIGQAFGHSNWAPSCAACSRGNRSRNVCSVARNAANADR
jgi:hypothetical protein